MLKALELGPQTTMLGSKALFYAQSFIFNSQTLTFFAQTPLLMLNASFIPPKDAL